MRRRKSAGNIPFGKGFLQPGKIAILQKGAQKPQEQPLILHQARQSVVHIDARFHQPPFVLIRHIPFPSIPRKYIFRSAGSAAWKCAKSRGPKMPHCPSTII